MRRSPWITRSNQGGKDSVRRKLLASANLGNHQIEETDQDLVERMVEGGLPIFNGGTEVDASTIFRRRKMDEVVGILPKAAERFPHFWSEEREDTDGKESTLFAAAQLRRSIARGGSANLFVRASGDASAGAPAESQTYVIRAPDALSLAEEFRG